MTRNNARGLRQRGSRAALRMGNMIRRVVVAASQGEAWGFEGYAIPNLRGEESFELEGEGDEPIEVFQGIGIVARPAAGDDAEALVFAVGAEAEHQVVGAVRSEAARARYLEEFGEIAAGEIAIFNSAGSARVLVRADGTIEITAASGQEILLSAGGATDRLVTRTEFMKHGHLTAGTGAVTPPMVAPAPSVDPAFPGTQVVKGE